VWEEFKAGAPKVPTVCCEVEWDSLRQLDTAGRLAAFTGKSNENGLKGAYARFAARDLSIKPADVEGEWAKFVRFEATHRPANFTEHAWVAACSKSDGLKEWDKETFAKFGQSVHALAVLTVTSAENTTYKPLAAAHLAAKHAAAATSTERSSKRKMLGQSDSGSAFKINKKGHTNHLQALSDLSNGVSLDAMAGFVWGYFDPHLNTGGSENMRLFARSQQFLDLITAYTLDRSAFDTIEAKLVAANSSGKADVDTATDPATDTAGSDTTALALRHTSEAIKYIRDSCRALWDSTQLGRSFTWQEVPSVTVDGWPPQVNFANPGTLTAAHVHAVANALDRNEVSFKPVAGVMGEEQAPLQTLAVRALRRLTQCPQMAGEQPWERDALTSVLSQLDVAKAEGAWSLRSDAEPGTSGLEAQLQAEKLKSECFAKPLLGVLTALHGKNGARKQFDAMFGGGSGGGDAADGGGDGAASGAGDGAASGAGTGAGAGGSG